MGFLEIRIAIMPIKIIMKSRLTYPLNKSQISCATAKQVSKLMNSGSYAEVNSSTNEFFMDAV